MVSRPITSKNRAAQNQRIFWISTGGILTQNSSRDFLKNHYIGIVDGKIFEIAKSLSDKEIRKAKKENRFEDNSKYIIAPGFIHTHLHLCQTLLRNSADDLDLLDWLSKRIWPGEASHTRDSIRLSAEIGIRELLSGGTTGILDMGTISHTDVILEEIEKFGIRASVGKCLMDDIEYTPKYLREDKRKSFLEIETLLKNWNGRDQNRIEISLAPRFAISCTESLLKEVSTLAVDNKLTVHTHACESVREIELVKKKTGLSNIDYLNKCGLLGKNVVLAHGVWLKSNEVKKIVHTNTCVSHCPSSNLKLASGIAPIQKYLDQKMRISLGADGAPCNNHLNMFHEMRTASLLQKSLNGPKALNAQTTFDLATIEGAKALGWWDRVGSIEVGKEADIFAISLSNYDNAAFGDSTKEIVSALVYSSDRHHVKWTRVKGEMVFDRTQGNEIWPKANCEFDFKSDSERIKRAQLKLENRISQL